jgi:hypothetical protein
MEAHRVFLVFAFGSEEKINTSLNCQSVDRKQLGEVFLVDD